MAKKQKKQKKSASKKYGVAGFLNSQVLAEGNPMSNADAIRHWDTAKKETAPWRWDIIKKVFAPKPWKIWLIAFFIWLLWIPIYPFFLFYMGRKMKDRKAMRARYSGDNKDSGVFVSLLPYTLTLDLTGMPIDFCNKDPEKLKKYDWDASQSMDEKINLLRHIRRHANWEANGSSPVVLHNASGPGPREERHRVRMFSTNNLETHDDCEAVARQIDSAIRQYEHKGPT